MSALVIASFGFIFRKGMLCLVTALLSSVCVILFARSEWLIPSFVVLAAMAYSQASFRTTNGALIQLLSPDALRGRITSLQNYGQGFVPISSILIGLFAWYTSAPLASTVGGIAGVSLAVVFLLASRTLRRLE